ncbi:MAG: DMT family transporter [Dehalococcoidia bacterium]
MKPLRDLSTLRKGAYFALATAVISGFSVYINKFAVSGMDDPFVFVAVKNVAVALLLFSLLILPRALPELKALNRRQWLMLGAIGCVGGSVPFLLFFYGLSIGNAASAAFIHKTMFIWAAILGVAFLREKVGKPQIAAIGVLFGGNILLLGWPGKWLVGEGELLIFLATILWAVETVLARKAMAGMGANVAAFGRMSFGALVLLLYLAFAGKMGTVMSLGPEQVAWTGLTGLFLFGYVTCYYAGLKHAPVSVVTGILVLGSLITSMLYAVFDARTYTADQLVGLVLIAVAGMGLLYLAPRPTTREQARPASAEI